MHTLEVRDGEAGNEKHEPILYFTVNNYQKAKFMFIFWCSIFCGWPRWKYSQKQILWVCPSAATYQTVYHFTQCTSLVLHADAHS